MNAVIQFLILNGFKDTSIMAKQFTNSKCIIEIYEGASDYYSVYDIKEGMTMYSKDLNIYWLIGVLTYYKYIDRDYKDLILVEERGPNPI